MIYSLEEKYQVEVLAHLLAVPTSRNLLQYIHEEFFTSWKLKEILKVIKAYPDSDFVTIQNEAKKNKVTFSDFSEIIEEHSTMFPVISKLRVLREESKIKLLKQVRLDSIEETEKEIEKIKKLFDDGFEKEAKTLNDIAIQVFEDRERGQSFEGFPSGISGLDFYIEGLVKGKFIVVGGYNSHGKSTLAVNMLNSAVQNGAKALFFSLEMNEKEILVKLLACRNSIDIMDFYKKSDNQQKEMSIHKALTEIAEEKLEVENSIDDIDDIISEIKKKKPDVVFIDYLQNLSSKDTSERRELLEYASKKLRVLALQENICIVALSQVNEESASQKGFSVGLKGSGDISSASDVTLRIIREVDKDGIKSNRFGIIIHKNRYGKTGFLDLSIDESKGKIYGVTKKYDN